MPEPVESQNFQDVMAFEELKDGVIFPLSVKGCSIVLVRQGEDVRAFGGKCPHKSAPMEQGVYCKSRLHGDVLVCPWHKAAFSGETGKVVEPVAFADLPRYPVSVIEGRVLVGTVPLSVPEPQPRQAEEHILIIGAGAAGVSAAYTLRREGFAGKITLIGEERELPYDRTALSKNVLVSDTSRSVAPPIMSEADYARYQIDLVHGRVISLDQGSRRITLEDEQVLEADHIIIATGSKPKRPDIPGILLDGVMTLNTQKDARLIAEYVTPEQAVILIGGGLIALEVASSLRQKGVGVTIISSESVPMEAQFGREIGTRLLQLHEDNSVAFINDAAITEIYGNGRVEGVTLDDGTKLPCSYVIAAIGVKPNCDFIDQSLRLGPEGSLLVNEAMHVLVDIEAEATLSRIHAVGDVSAVMRNKKIWQVQHWRHAEILGRIAALDILGYPLREIPVPWFWTQQFGRRIEYLGWGEKFDHVVLEGDLRDFRFLATYTDQGRVVGLAGAGRAVEMARATVNFDSFAKEGAEALPI